MSSKPNNPEPAITTPTASNRFEFDVPGVPPTFVDEVVKVECVWLPAGRPIAARYPEVKGAKSVETDEEGKRSCALPALSAPTEGRTDRGPPTFRSAKTEPVPSAIYASVELINGAITIPSVTVTPPAIRFAVIGALHFILPVEALTA